MNSSGPVQMLGGQEQANNDGSFVQGFNGSFGQVGIKSRNYYKNSLKEISKLQTVAEEQSSTISKSEQKSNISKSFGMSQALKLKTFLSSKEKSNKVKSPSKMSKLSMDGSSIYELSSNSRAPLTNGNSNKSLKNMPMVHSRSPNKLSFSTKTKQPKMNSYINIRYSEDIATSSLKKSSTKLLQNNLQSESKDKLRLSQKCQPFYQEMALNEDDL